jgi:cation-transporting ATPase 13A1
VCGACGRAHAVLRCRYEATYQSLAERGFRVLALAYKQSPKFSAADAPSRVDVEVDCQFGGFVAFECKIRSDSPTVIKALEQADLRTAMLTGDAPLTALHVARHVGMCSMDKPALTLTATKEAGKFGVEWETATGLVKSKIPFEIGTVATLMAEYELMSTESALDRAVDLSGKDESEVWDIVQHIKVFARMSPNGKASVIRALQVSVFP